MSTKLNNPQNRFIALFIGLFLLFYYFNLAVWSLSSPKGTHYNAFIADHFNYIGGMRTLLIELTVGLLKLFDYTVISNIDEVMIPGHGYIRVAYDCIGMAVLSFFSAFAIAYPKPIKTKLLFLFGGIIAIQTLNVCRMALLAIYWNTYKHRLIDHHLIFNIFIYTVIGISIYFYTKRPFTVTRHAKN